MKTEISVELKQKIDDKIAYIRNELVTIAIELEAETPKEFSKIITSVLNNAAQEATMVYCLQLGMKSTEENKD